MVIKYENGNHCDDTEHGNKSFQDAVAVLYSACNITDDKENKIDFIDMGYI